MSEYNSLLQSTGQDEVCGNAHMQYSCLTATFISVPKYCSQIATELWRIKSQLNIQRIISAPPSSVPSWKNNIKEKIVAFLSYSRSRFLFYLNVLMNKTSRGAVCRHTSAYTPYIACVGVSVCALQMYIMYMCALARLTGLMLFKNILISICNAYAEYIRVWKPTNINTSVVYRQKFSVTPHPPQLKKIK